MATGDQADCTARIRAVLPPSWFVPGLDLILEALLSGGGYVAALVYSIVAFARLQVRINTATGGWLDMICYDFLGRKFSRNGTTDAVFRAAIRRRILRQNATRAGIAAELHTLTGNTPVLIEGFNPSDCGCLGGGGAPVLIGYAGGGTGYSSTASTAGAGYWGTRNPAQLFVLCPAGTSTTATVYQTVNDMTAAGVAASVATY